MKGCGFVKTQLCCHNDEEVYERQVADLQTCIQDLVAEGRPKPDKEDIDIVQSLLLDLKDKKISGLGGDLETVVNSQKDIWQALIQLTQNIDNMLSQAGPDDDNTKAED